MSTNTNINTQAIECPCGHSSECVSDAIIAQIRAEIDRKWNEWSLSKKQPTTNPVVNWLLSLRPHIEGVKELNTSDWYSRYRNWAQAANETKIISLNTFSGLLKAEGIEMEVRNVGKGDQRRKFRYRTISRDIIDQNLSHYIR